MASRKPISYQWRLFIPLVALLWSVIISLALFQYQREKDFRSQRLNDELRLINSRIINAYENDLDMEPFMSFLAQYYDHSELKGIRVSVYDKDGELLYCIGTPIPGQQNGDNLPPELAEATVKGYGTALRPNDMDVNNPYYFFGVNTSADGHIYVHTAMPYTGAISRQVTVDHSLWVIIVILAVAVTTIAYLSTRFLGKNIKILHDFANNAANAVEFDYDINDFPHDELGGISRQIVTLFREREEAVARSEREHRIALKATEEKIRVTRQLSNNINHELKTPVGVIKGYLDTMADHPEMDEASRQRFIGKAQEHMTRLCNMLSDLSSITRLEDGGKGVMREKVDFHELMSNVESELASIQLNNGVVFSFDIPAKCYVLGNYNLLYGMIVNLIRNADFHSKGTMCRLELVGQNSREYRFVFFDNGTGVGEEHLPHLFERFYRIDKGRSRKAGGTGLGLPIVKNTVNIMGGTILVQNHKPHGLEFVFTLIKWKEEQA